MSQYVAASAAMPGAGETAKQMKRRARLFFWKATIPDFLLVLAVSIGVSITVLWGFNVSPVYATDPVFTGIAMVPPLVAMFAGSLSKRARAISIIATVAILVVYLIIGFTSSFGDDLLADVPENRYIIAIVWAVVPVIVYLLSRKPVSLVFLLAGCIIACAAIEYVYEGGLFWQFVVVIVGMLMLFVFQTYRSSVASASRAKGTHFFQATVFSAIITAISIGMAFAVFFAFIAPMNLTEAEFKLFEKEYQLETIYYTAIANTQNVDDPNSRTNNTDETKENTDKQDQSNQESSGNSDMSLGEMIASALSGFNPNNDNEELDNMSYERFMWEFIAIIVGIILVIAGIILLRRSRREARLKKLADKTNAERVIWIFNFLTGRLKRLGFTRPAHMTAGEYAVASYRGMKPFSRDTDGVSFLNVTETFYRAYYGGAPVTDVERAQVENYYRCFFKNAFRYVGWPKWAFWKFWRI